MVLVSSFVSLLERHQMSLPENLLDNTDFVPQLFKFLEHYNVNLPTETIPKFLLNTLAPVPSQSSPPVRRSQISSTKRKSKRRRSSRRLSDKKSKEQKPCETTAPEKEVSAQVAGLKSSLHVDELRLSFVKAEEEKTEIQNQESGVQKPRNKNEDTRKEQEENVNESSEKKDLESKIISVGSSEENSSCEELISVPPQNN